MVSIEDISIAALLHDIGKIVVKVTDKKYSNDINTKYKNLLQNFPEMEKNKHTIYGYEFYERIEKDFQQNNFLKNNEFIKSAILHHHTSDPPNKLVRLISIADRVSSAEREDYNNREDFSKYLINIFSTINLDKNDSDKDDSSFSNQKNYRPIFTVSELVNNGNYFVDSKGDFVVNYRKILDGIKNSFSQIKNIEEIFYIWREFTSNIPAAYYYSKPTISLFAHSLSTSAVATSLYRQFEEMILNEDYSFIEDLQSVLDKEDCSEKKLISKKDYSEKKLMGIIKGDISGIQNFIFNTSYDKALKQLKGKSFFLELIVELVARYIVYQEGLTIGNILMSGGGHFYLLVPAKTIDNLDKYKQYLENLFYRAFGNDLAIVLTGMKVSIPDLEYFSKTLEKLNKLHDKSKARKMESVIFSECFFETQKINYDDCPHCKKTLVNQTCNFCESFSELAEELTKNEYIHINYKHSRDIKKINNIDNIFKFFETLGFYISFDNNYDQNSFRLKNKCNSTSFIKYLPIANYIPLSENNQIKNLNEISQESSGIKRWGILKGDVDNLGEIFFSLSDEQEKSSLSKTVSLSYELKVFFGLVMERIVEQKYKNCIIVYSGGDDFIIIGPHSDLYYLAKDINNEFKKFTGNRDDITLSMSFVISVNEKHPVYRVAIQANNYLDEAKNDGKNSINVLGKTIKWKDLPKFDEILSTLLNILGNGGSKAIITYLIDSYHERDNFRTSWRLFYKLYNYRSRFEKTKDDIDKLRDLIYSKEGNKIYENLYQVAKLADYLTRQ